ncbi:hypothetical protein HPP92_007793 [Vanilla planifolia]|uniref:Uncharacterized protein n=1 Tax=Vanilla planifolia TaxID=51239 RepID=A0A835VBK3_VANPL|nr:hypothetical protein HPP92_007793 [Vanilla planifolia]
MDSSTISEAASPSPITKQFLLGNVSQVTIKLSSSNYHLSEATSTVCTTGFLSHIDGTIIPPPSTTQTETSKLTPNPSCFNGLHEINKFYHGFMLLCPTMPFDKGWPLLQYEKHG